MRTFQLEFVNSHTCYYSLGLVDVLHGDHNGLNTIDLALRAGREMKTSGGSFEELSQASLRAPRFLSLDS